MNQTSIRPEQPSKLNPANAFTALRLPLAVVGFFVFTSVSPWWGVVIIVAAAWTDFFDGIVARRFDCVSDFGANFDPIVDKIFQGMVLVFTFTQVDLFALHIQLGTIAVVEVAIAALTIYANGLGKTFKVTGAGKKGMFARMTCVTWLLAGSINNRVGWHGTITTIGQYAGIIGTFLGAWAFREYLTQLKASHRIAPQYKSA